MKKEEIWKEYPIKIQFDTPFKIEVSNRGRVKIFSKLYPEGYINRGTMRNGYPFISSKVNAPKNDKEIHQLSLIKDEIDRLNSEIKNLRNEFSFKDLQSESAQNLLKNLRKQRDSAIQKHKRKNHKIRKKIDVRVCFLIHRVVAELFLPQPEQHQKFVIHKDFNKENNDYENLAWASREELNERFTQHPKVAMDHFKQKLALKPRGNKFSKLTEMDVLFIKEKLKKGVTLKELAKRFKVSDMQIHRIKTGENWGHVKTVEELKLETNL